MVHVLLRDFVSPFFGTSQYLVMLGAAEMFGERGGYLTKALFEYLNLLFDTEPLQSAIDY